MAHRFGPPPANGHDALLTSDIYVTKIGGDTAEHLARNAGVIRRRMQNLHTQVLAVSAIRSSDSRFTEFAHPVVTPKKPGFNTTSHLIAIAESLRAGEKEPAKEMARRIAAFTRSIVDAETDQDGLLQNRTATRDRLQDIIARAIEDPFAPRSLLHTIENAHPEEIHNAGEDWLHVSPADGTRSITGLGEVLAQEITRAYLGDRGIATAPLDIGDEQAIYEAEEHGEHALALKKLQDGIRRSLTRTLPSHSVIVAGGYAPPLGSERGYSDKTGALIAHVIHEIGGDVAYLIEKESPIMSADPRTVQRTRVVPRMTPFLAKELFGNARGADAGAIHPEALDILAADGIPIVVQNPQDDPAQGATTLISEFHPAPNGVEIIHSKPVPFAIEIQTGSMIGREGFEEDIARWFAAHHVSIQHIATSEGSISYTFDNGRESAATVAALRRHIAERYGVDGTVAVRTVEGLAAVYCLGNDMRTPGQAEKAAFALKSAGVNIHMISQGLNQASMVFLVSAADAPRAVQALHDIFITLPDATYQRIMAEARLKIDGAIAAQSPILSPPVTPLV